MNVIFTAYQHRGSAESGSIKRTVQAQRKQQKWIDQTAGNEYYQANKQ
jgi:regulator of extracellular matrix RemA (YlzA/DUF370 family)